MIRREDESALSVPKKRRLPKRVLRKIKCATMASHFGEPVHANWQVRKGPCWAGTRGRSLSPAANRQPVIFGFDLQHFEKRLNPQHRSVIRKGVERMDDQPFRQEIAHQVAQAIRTADTGTR